MSLFSPVAPKIHESFERSPAALSHRIEGKGFGLRASLVAAPGEADEKSAWWRAYLRGARPVAARRQDRVLRVADLFCGAGGLALGLRQLLDEAGIRPDWELVVDRDDQAAAVYAANHAPRRVETGSVSDLLDYRVRRGRDGAEFAYEPELLDAGLADALRGLDLVLAGPPCEGHSNLNNHTRRADRRNHLYLAVPAFAVAAEARAVLIENVPAVRNDHAGVVESARRLLEHAGYRVDTGVLAADAMGWPQTRRRFFLVARKGGDPIPLAAISRGLAEKNPRPLSWAVEGIVGRSGEDALHQVGELSEENRRRIAWLFDHDQHDLAFSERPRCHRNGTTYAAVYGRMHADRPAPTITTGFLTPGRGRFVHPTERRTLTLREAARLQAFPDDYLFTPDPGAPPSRGRLARWIGDAVPMPLGYAAALSVLGPEIGARRR